MKDTHLTDDVLTALCLTGPGADGSGHLGACPACERRLVSLAAMLEEVSDSAAASADEAFPPERRARQHARILQRLDHHASFGKVLAFPHAAPGASVPFRPTRVRRWVAGAAAAGLFVGGMLAGLLLHQIPVSPRSTPAQATPVQTAPARQSAPALRTVSASLSDDELLLEIERSIARSGPMALHRLDALTPVAWEP